ncbi:hypothetical protein MKZ17_06085 [Solibacillus sp. FSL R7-0682]|uniref:hypothetical protein n=1 Tax=Solibacillus sp. FSL R7-0682 TaxID=2921690 RepID=UPI0030FC97D1
MKKILITVLFSSFIFLIPSAITANKTETKTLNIPETKILDENTLAEKLEEHLKYQAIKGMKEHNALSVTSVLTDSEGNVLNTFTIYKDDN